MNKMDVNLEEKLVDERDELMLRSENTTGPYLRKGYFLKPQDYLHGKNIEVVPFLPTLKRSSTYCLYKQANKVTFKGWPNPQQNWEQWVDRLSQSYGNIWKNAGIFDAIQVSTCKIRRDFTSFWEVLSYWNSETNTFIFPSFEATITLEDAMILGGFSPIGRCVRGVDNLNRELEDINLRLTRAHKYFNKTKSKKACFSAWMNHFMGCNDGSIEHISFLSLWLSRYVFPRAPGDVIQRELFPIAILLAQGERFALGPAVLASLYRDLSFLASDTINVNLPILVWAPFGILQMWIWDRFLSLRKHTFPNLIQKNKPWASRWHNTSISRLSSSEFIIESAHSFNWRPYTETSENWTIPAYYKDKGRWVSSSELNELWDVSFAQCVRACELIGLKGNHLYLPCRVARQFGYDQDVSGCAKINSSASNWEVALSLYGSGTNFLLYIPPWHSLSELTVQYSSWWKDNIYSNSMFDVDEETEDDMDEETEDDVAEENEISTFSEKRQKTEIALNVTPLNGSLIEGLTRVNVKTIKAVARTIKNSSITDVNHNHGAAGDVSCAGESSFTPGSED